MPRADVDQSCSADVRDEESSDREVRARVCTDSKGRPITAKPDDKMDNDGVTRKAARLG